MNNNSVNNQFVSIIMPTYNSEKFVIKTIESVLNQTFTQFELIIIDDFSTDNTESVVRNLIDPRLRYFKLESNSGAAVARNYGIKVAKGNYLAFIDSDDIWFEEKLEKQLKFMELNNIDFSCTYYNKIDEDDFNLNKVVRNKSIIDYDSLLKNNCGNSTVMYNSGKIGKFYIPDIKKRNDYTMWLQVIKKTTYLYTLPEVLSSHRIRLNSLSSNKIDLIKYHWKVYRSIEKLSLRKSVFLIFYWTVYKQFLSGGER